MNVMQKLVTVVAVIVLVTRTAAGQGPSPERSRVALDIGTTTPLALLWKLSDDFALRPDLTFSHFDNGGSFNPWRFGVGVSALGSSHRSGALTTYIGVRGGYAWYALPDSPTDWTFAGIFGGRFAIDPRFGISGETGIAYDRLRIPGPGSDESALGPWGRLSVLLFF